MVFNGNETTESKIRFDVKNKIKNRIFDDVAFNLYAGVSNALHVNGMHIKECLEIRFQVRDDLDDA